MPYVIGSCHKSHAESCRLQQKHIQDEMAYVLRERYSAIIPQCSLVFLCVLLLDPLRLN